MNPRRSMFVCSLLFISLAALAGGGKVQIAHEAKPSEIAAALGTLSALGQPAAAAEWGYNEVDGPDHWCQLDPTYALCCAGKTQTPIDFKTNEVTAGDLPRLWVEFKTVALEVVHNGHTIQANASHGEKAGLRIGDKEFELVQFHFHTASEHLVNGTEFPLELHLVHRASDGSLAVLGVFIVSGASNEELDKIWKSLPKHAGDSLSVASFDLRKLLPPSLDSMRYSGSLTTPPCSEGVNWTVLAQPISLSPEQIQAFKNIFSGEEFPHGNRRPVQPLQGRSVIFNRAVNLDVCIQDDQSGDLLQFSTFTGDYRFIKCGAGGFTLTGRATVTRGAGQVQLSDARIFATLSRNPFSFSSSGNATVRSSILGTAFDLEDRSTANNTCACP